MSSRDLIFELRGGKCVVDWFGRIPRFHDAEILGINLRMGQISSIKIHAWNMLNTIDSKGFYKTDKHAVITVEFARIRQIFLTDFDNDFEHIPIINSLEFSGTALRTEIRWVSSVGVDGSIEGEGVSLTLHPGKP